MIKKVHLFTLESRFGDKYLFCDSVNAKFDPFIIFDGKKYNFLACKYFDKGGTSTSDRTGEFSLLNMRNKDVNVGQTVEENGNFLGWRLEVRTIDHKFLDLENFEDIEEITPDNSQGYISTWIVKKRSNLNSRQIDFDLGGALGDLASSCGTKISTDHCPYMYRDAMCGYAGGAVADKLDNPTNDLSKDFCAKRIKSCTMRFPNQPLPGLFFPAASTAREFK